MRRSSSASLLCLLAVGADALSIKASIATPKTTVARSSKIVAVSSIEEPEPFEGAVKVVSDVAITGLRLGTCALMIHHGIDKLTVRSSLPYILP